jgi:hypothetical protein
MSKSDKHDKGIEIHARVLISRFGKKAQEDAENHAKKLKKKGDIEGYEVWILVADKIKDMKTKKTSKNEK